jgi:hypothetical protein
MIKQILILSFLICTGLGAQNLNKKVLFLGNSYTGVNNLPQMIANVALSVGDSLIFDSNTPGGYTLQGHSTNATSLSKIAVGDWDFVVLQEQSQLPSFPDGQVQSSVFPFARALDSIINANNSCVETVFYMTWGRKNGDASNCANFSPVCTYMGMDSLLRLRYTMMADDNHAILSPVGALWRYIRQNHPLIELYQSDESHPSVAGTYAAACAFYTVLFRKDPNLISFNSSLSASDAATIRAAAKTLIFDSLTNWFIGTYDPSANFAYSSNANEISFTDSSANATSYFWDFGDGNSSTLQNPTHLYDSCCSYTVSLIVENCGQSDTLSRLISFSQANSLSDHETESISIFPNPSNRDLIIKSNPKIQGNKFLLYNSSGQLMLTGSINSDKEVVDISKLLPGFYILKIGNSSFKFQKVH